MRILVRLLTQPQPCISMLAKPRPPGDRAHRRKPTTEAGGRMPRRADWRPPRRSAVIARNRGEDTLTRLTLIALPIRCGSPTHKASAAIALGVALAAAPSAALADAQVRGSPAAVTVEATNTSVEEVLKALSGAFDVHYRSSVNLQTRLTGNYEGSLQRVMKRVLDGYSYFVKIGDGRIDVTVLDGPRGAPLTGAADFVRVVAPPAEAAPAQPSPVIAAVEASPPAPSAATSSSFGSVGPRPSSPPQTGQDRVGAPAPPPPAIAGVDPPAPPAPSSRRRDNPAVVSGKESRPLPPRRIKVASSSGHWKKGRHHARRTRLANSTVLCRRPVSSFGLPMMIPVSSYYWFQRRPLYVRSVPNCTLRRYGRVK
jgi:hypothetical protein